MVIDTAMYTIHTALAAFWAGTVLFVAVAVVPLAMDGELSPAAFGIFVSKLQWITRLSALFLLVTGGHLAGTLYDVNTLTGTSGGYLVLVMLALWFVLITVVEIGSAKAQRGIEEEKIRKPARDSRPFYHLAGVVAVALLVVAGLLGTPAQLF